jgi:hypothetical protein
MSCLFCLFENVEGTLVCVNCSRDIAIPALLIAERDELLQKRDAIKTVLLQAREELELIRTGKKLRFR